MKIDSSYYLGNQTTRSAGSELGKNDFLKILMAQLKNQDPLKPLEDKEFISQMASFSSLEQMVNMTESLEQMTRQQPFSPIFRYSGLIGKEISYSFGEGEEAGKGKVKAVSQVDDQFMLELESGERVNVKEVVKISNPVTEQGF